jgi:hypothetical protein
MTDGTDWHETLSVWNPGIYEVDDWKKAQGSKYYSGFQGYPEVPQVNMAGTIKVKNHHPSMKKTIVLFFGTLLLVFTATSLLTAQSSVLPRKVKLSLKAGKSYVAARKVLQTNGWKPVNNYRNLSKIDREHYVVKNLRFYEMESCSGTGVGYCNFIFKNKNGKTLTVTTVGNDETEGGKPRVSGYRID